MPLVLTASAFNTVLADNIGELIAVLAVIVTAVRSTVSKLLVVKYPDVTAPALLMTAVLINALTDNNGTSILFAVIAPLVSVPGVVIELAVIGPETKPVAAVTVVEDDKLLAVSDSVTLTVNTSISHIPTIIHDRAVV